MRSINLVVIHCAATPNGVWVSPAQIDKWHEERGFKRDAAFAKEFRPNLPHIGYHRVVLADGSIAQGRELEEVGAHVAGYNLRSVGVCLVGTSSFFLDQWRALRVALGTLAGELMLRAGKRVSMIPGAWPARDVLQVYRDLGVEIKGHRDLSPDADHDGTVEPREWLKICPGFDVLRWLDAGMEPEPVHILDDHPAIAQSDSVARVMVGMQRWGVQP